VLTSADAADNLVSAVVIICAPFQLCCCIAELHCNVTLVRLSLVTNKGYLLIYLLTFLLT